MHENIESNRLILKRTTREDAVYLVEYLKEPKIKDIIGLPTTTTNLEEYISKTQNSNSNQRRTIYKKENNTIIGSLTLRNISEKNQRADIGFWIGEKHEKQGYISEILPIFIDYIFSHTTIERIQAWIKTDNYASIKCIEKQGFIREGTARNYIKKGDTLYDFHLYGLLKK